MQYTGQMWLPEAGLTYSKARNYLPSGGIFAQTDPIRFAGGVNFYAYTGNDPVNGIDPTGLVNPIVVTGQRLTCSDVCLAIDASLIAAWFSGTGVASGVGGTLLQGGDGSGCPTTALLAPPAAVGAATAGTGTAAGAGLSAVTLGVVGILSSLLSGDTPQPPPDITIYRVVGNVEYAGIRATNSFQLLPGGGETKQFWLTAGGAAWYANSLVKSGMWKGPLTTVSTRVSPATLSMAEHFQPENRPGVAFRAGAPLSRLNADAARNGINTVNQCGGRTQ
jgi:RHS repeat-associated protein